MWRESDPPIGSDDHHICEDDYNPNAGDDDANLTITIEELLSFLGDPPPNNGCLSHTKLHKDSIESTFAPERGKSEVSDLEKESGDAPLIDSGEHGLLQCIPINYFDISHDEQGASLGHSFDVTGTSRNFTNIWSPTCESDNFDSPVDDVCFSHEMYDTSSHRLLFPSSDFVTRDISDDDDSRQINNEQVCVPCHLVLEDASHHDELVNSESYTVKGNGKQEVGHAGDSSFKMVFGSAREMTLPLSSDMLKHGDPELDIMLNKKVRDDSFYRELDEESPSLGGNFCMSSSVETSSNHITSGCSTGDSRWGVFSEDNFSSQCLQHHSFPSGSVEAPFFHRDDVSDGEPCYSGRLYIENQGNLVSPGRNFSNHPCDMPILNMNSMAHDINYHRNVNFKHPFSIKSSSFLTNGMIPSGDFHGCVIDATKYGSGFKQVTPGTQSMDQLEDGLPSSQHKSSINEATLLNIPLDSVVDNYAEVSVLDSVDTSINLPLPSVAARSCAVIPSAEHSDTIYPQESTSRPKAHDEMLTFQIALQGLSQPTSESTPPDGVLSVPLLRHQRIALSWMVERETASLNCSGGILADDQGLGKTVSTIALILKERSPLTQNCGHDAKMKVETLSVDDDDEEGAGLNGFSQPLIFDLATSEKTRGCDNGFTSVKGRPAAGTLVVCPTSVLRQWAEELQSKVTSKGNLSFLVYHGSNRTKDPNELSKYDVVLTTYSIVSMELPNQLSGESEDEEKGKGSHPAVVSSNRKRKISTTNNSKYMKAKTMTNYTLLESTARPLARVAWFRVILDEAQTIKNHRTQVARACCGLRAKRRWCLSGTPIQNAIDDLYSYFRFLRYDPYAVYSSFCSKIKTPISKHPTTGYKKLQAVLKAIMLRRTKGSCIDGQPIIELPPKSITLRLVEFSQEERSFYSNLEAESREQFKIYAEAGTVKQNYVNILLMLLRLRQACDHPHLVRGYDSNSVWKASLESAKRLPKDKMIHLLNCLEASLAICTICKDPPEDAVVTICAHVFCNQCVRDHLAGDDNQCPSPCCKHKLDVASVFSKDLLKSSVIDMPGNGTPDASCYELSTKSPSADCADSSKIRAAIEILQSLPRLNDCTFFTESDVDTSEVTHTKQNPSLVNGCDGHMTEKAIVFSQWTRMLDLLEVRLKSSSLHYRRLDGTMPIAARDRAIKDFNTRPEVTVMIMSLKAASLGLNLVSACHVLLLDLWWNPTTEDQAIDRAHRIGQTRPVTVSRLTVTDTIEDRILALQEKKREMVASAFGEDKTGGRQTRLTVEDLRYLFMV